MKLKPWAYTNDLTAPHTVRCLQDDKPKETGSMKVCSCIKKRKYRLKCVSMCLPEESVLLPLMLASSKSESGADRQNSGSQGTISG